MKQLLARIVERAATDDAMTNGIVALVNEAALNLNRFTKMAEGALPKVPAHSRGPIHVEVPAPEEPSVAQTVKQNKKRGLSAKVPKAS